MPTKKTAKKKTKSRKPAAKARAKKSRKRKPSSKTRRGNAVGQAERERMFHVYCDRQSVQHVSRVCRRSHVTVRKYKDLDNWDKRLPEVKRMARERSNEKAADKIARQIDNCEEIQEIGMEAVRVGRFAGINETTKDAAHAVLEAGKEQRVLMGQPGERVEFIDTLQERYARRRKKAGK